jgi:acyl carrier protein
MMSQPSRAEVLESIRNNLSTILDVPDLQLSERSTSDSVKDWDSVNHVRLMLALETEMGVHFQTDELTKAKDVGDLIDMIERKF